MHLAKLAFAWQEQVALHVGKALTWPGASQHIVPAAAWSDQKSSVGLESILKATVPGIEGS